MSDPREDIVGRDRHPSESVTPYVGKRARRDVAADEQPIQQAQPTQPYVGRRAARPAADAAPVVHVPAPTTPYVGKRARRDVVETPAETPTMPVVEQVVPTVVEQVVEPVVQPVVRPVIEPAVAFVKPVVPVALLDEPRPAPEWNDWNIFAAESPEDTGQLPFALTEAFTGSLPRIDAEPGTDFTFDTTATLPKVTPGKRARAARRPRRSVLPSLPALVGVAALAIAGFGALTGGKSDMVRADAAQLRQAGALTGSSAVASVGQRGVAVSRGGGRSDANTAAQAHESALAAINKKASGWASVLKKNQWQLPVTAGVYHLTARFGDCGLWAHCHTGLDFAAPTGTPIHAISNGVIASTTPYDGAYGNKTVETLEDGTELWYCHQVRFGVSPGQEVHAGDIIGYVGSTGHVTGPHVHVEVRPGGGDPVDPYPALVAHGLQP
ncbi:M23 family metallopeptidase [Nocardioides sp. CER19]|uniref:M23 family metallopeptidase n=1 Tax=Nocardioides sp. CER19 TaxID=3038538 RepID=UPI00244BDB26|nr:M23 family metallopeptidase [Nocardioides sp. CER19]MDH2413648.1 M23 family metallopeptidase [Nocardioides sp. CER19]